MKLLITGSTGFVGRNLLLHALRDPYWSEIILPVRNREKLHQQLQAEGIDPYLKTNSTKLHIGIVHENRWILNDLPSPDLVIHCAGLTFSREKEDYFSTNVEGTLNLLQSLPPTTRLLVLSSLAAAGPTPNGAIARTNHHKEAPVSWYGESKLTMEKEVLARRSEQLLIVRPPIILGPRDTATIPLFKMARGLLRIKPGLNIKQYSWLDVDDLCQALLIAGKADWPTVPHPPYFLAANHSITDLELLSTTAAILGAYGIIIRVPHSLIQLISLLADKIPALHKPLQSISPDRVKEIIQEQWVADGRPFQHDFNWSPTSSLAESLKRTAAWLEIEPTK